MVTVGPGLTVISGSVCQVALVRIDAIQHYRGQKPVRVLVFQADAVDSHGESDSA